jgi:NAD(P)-dependent dehydrogenase (short-subunit alcohol dehydrogenase family)
LDGKVALVTGGTRGLGRTTAEWLARDGASLVISAREPDKVSRAVEELKEFGTQVWGVAADLAQISEAHRLAAETLRLVPQLDVLVNNAGMSTRGNFWEVTDRDWEYQTNVNFRSPFILAQHAAKQMIERGIRGRIVNTSTIGARACHTNGLVYDAAKGAVETMTRNMAYELAPYGITVNCVVPGAISERPGSNINPERIRSYVRHIPSARIGRSTDTAAVVRFFCRPESEFITGESLLVSGGPDLYLPEFYKRGAPWRISTKTLMSGRSSTPPRRSPSLAARSCPRRCARR